MEKINIREMKPDDYTGVRAVDENGGLKSVIERVWEGPKKEAPKK